MHIADVQDWDKLSWENKRIYLQGVFTRGEILESTRQELEVFLVVLANANPAAFSKELDMALMEKQAIVIRHLLQIRLGEELHWRSYWVSILAIVLSFLALIVSSVDMWHKYAQPAKATPQTLSTTNRPAP
jgi:hypothetical protein